ncbi:MAG TPA: hypothetical protein VMZ30_12440 [Pyrinomonadaceae bacterium]|nr:hypothetical protein [Pyrinomonadaceae bacterium]
MAEPTSDNAPLLWQDIPAETREDLKGKLRGLWGAANDEAAFNACAIDKQQTLLIMVTRLREKRLWQVIKKIDNVYGEGGVGIGFTAWPLILSTLSRRKDFTRRFANHNDTTGGFYEKGRGDAVLHFLYVAGNPQKWYVHFDLYSPVHSPVSMLKHVRHEFLGKLTPDWRMIQRYLNA